jgi:hypothetical protein
MAELIPVPIMVLLKRGTREQNDAYIGEPGEVTVVVDDSGFGTSPETTIVVDNSGIVDESVVSDEKKKPESN